MRVEAGDWDDKDLGLSRAATQVFAPTARRPGRSKFMDGMLRVTLGPPDGAQGPLS